MPQTNKNTETIISTRTVSIAALLIIGSIAAYLIYAQGFQADWTFDDSRPLSGLTEVVDGQTALEYVLHTSGISPLERPLSLASFLINARDWPGNPAGFRQVNVLLHIFNGLLLALLTRQVANLIPGLAARATPFAISLSLIWLLHPLLASTSLMIVQRMTLLAATFSMLAVITYLYGRHLLDRYPTRGYLAMSLGIIFFTALGVLAKENAALTPLLIGILEATLLSVYAPVHHRKFRAWAAIFFLGPTLLLLGGLVITLDAVLAGYSTRPFSLPERILSESVILIEYVRQAFVPDTSTIGPFQDDTSRIYGANLVSSGALVLWACMTAAAFIWRRRAPAFSFAVLFFLAGHIIESTVLPLELYFEHRNYLPILGPLSAILGFIWYRWAKWASYASFFFVLIFSGLLWQATSLWGSPTASAIVWHKNHPTSVRAAQNLSTQYQKAGNLPGAATVIFSAYAANPLDAGIAMQAYLMHCFTTDDSARTEFVNNLANSSNRMHYSSGAPLALHRMIDLHSTGQCDSLKTADVIRISDELLGNTAFSNRKARYALYLASARSFEIQGDRQSSINRKLLAFNEEPTLQLAGTIYSELQAMDHSAAADFLEQARSRAPEFDAHYSKWEKQLNAE